MFKYIFSLFHNLFFCTCVLQLAFHKEQLITQIKFKQSFQ